MIDADELVTEDDVGPRCDVCGTIDCESATCARIVSSRERAEYEYDLDREYDLG